MRVRCALYKVTNIFRAVGFFANSNHNAALLYSAIVFSGAFAAIVARHYKHQSLILYGLAALAILMLLAGLALTESRAGIALGFVAILSSFAVGSTTGSRSFRKKRLLLWALISLLVVFLIALQAGLFNTIERAQDAEFSGDLRSHATAITFGAAWHSMPFGTGFGSFVPVFQMFEPRSLVDYRYVNHAHNDWAEILLDGGLIAYLLVAGFLAWLIFASRRLWTHAMSDASDADVILARAGSVVVVLLLLHSVVDYPLRTIAIMAVFALSCGLLEPAWPSEWSEMELVDPNEPTPRSRRLGPSAY